MCNVLFVVWVKAGTWHRDKKYSLPLQDSEAAVVEEEVTMDLAAHLSDLSEVGEEWTEVCSFFIYA